MKQIGELRKSQLITTFGIGSVVDLKDYSAMILGQNHWERSKLSIIREERLEKKLNVNHFMEPSVETEQFIFRAAPSIPCIRFPEWVFCAKCKRLAHYASFGGDDKTCGKCSSRGNRFQLIPSRFVITCNRGHIEDFPWNWWAHRGSSCPQSYLTISATGKSTSLGSIFIRCKNCDASRSLSGIFGKKALSGYSCSGKRLWLGRDYNENCDEAPVVLQRGSAGVWFPVLESALSIPPFSTRINAFLRQHQYLQYVPPEGLPETLKGLLKASGESFSIKLLINAITNWKNFAETEDQRDLRIDEYIALCNPETQDYKSDFYTVNEKVPKSLAKYFSQVVLVHRLREVRALRFFKRVDSNSPYEIPLSPDSENWLPAMEVKGEGIFIELDAAALENWKERGGATLIARAKTIERNRKKQNIRDGDKSVTPEFLLIHTLSHLFIQQLTIECGYSSAALRERLYVNDSADEKQRMHGLLIYTATADSEGSLGGLVRQGISERFEQVFFNALDSSRWCSNDPLCIESTGQGMNSLNLAACHTCSLLPETSCEQRNCYLDRGVLSGTSQNPELGFFVDLQP